MKVGILALLRDRMKVTYYTNREIWEFCFHIYPLPDGTSARKVLSVNLASYAPRIANRDPKLDDDIRTARTGAHKHTTVIVDRAHPFDVGFENFLFLVRPKSDEVLNTQWGSILLGKDYHWKVFVKGMFVEKRGFLDPPALYYGVNFLRSALNRGGQSLILNRDRQNLMTHGEVASTIAEMWNSLMIGETEGDKIVSAYLQIMLKEEEFLDTSMAEGHLSQKAAEKLLEQLKAMYPADTFFYFDQEATASEVLHISLSFSIWSF